MEVKKKRLCGLVSLIIMLSLAVTFFAMVVEASPETETWDWYDLDAVRNNLDGDYVLMNDLNSTTAGYTELASPTANKGMGWEPIGTQDYGFGGSVDGQGHMICDLYTYRPTELVGLFGHIIWEGAVSDIGMLNVTATGYQCVGGLAGRHRGTMRNCYTDGNVTGDNTVGGLVGQNWGTLSNCYATGNVSADSCDLGGLMGANFGTVNDCFTISNVTGRCDVGGLAGYNGGAMSNCYVKGGVIGSHTVGGMVGWNGGAVSNCHNNGNVTGEYYVGGLMGTNSKGTASSSYSRGNVTGDGHVGGLAGEASSASTVTNCYAVGSVTGIYEVGGLLGTNSWSTVSNCYAMGNVTGSSSVGGLVGLNDYGIAIDSFWDSETSGQSTSAIGTGKNTTEMQDISTFLGATWDIIAVDSGQSNLAYLWNIVDGESYPYLSMGKNGDVSNDDNVNVLDMVLIAQHWGEAGSPGWIPEDVNKDGVINVLDMIIIGQHWTG